YEYKNSGEFSADLEDYFSSGRMNDIEDRIRATAVTLQYWELVAADFRNDWYNSSVKARSWLRSQLQNDIQLEKEVLECARKFIAERYEVDDESVMFDEPNSEPKIFSSEPIFEDPLNRPESMSIGSEAPPENVNP